MFLLNIRLHFIFFLNKRWTSDEIQSWTRCRPGERWGCCRNSLLIGTKGFPHIKPHGALEHLKDAGSYGLVSTIGSLCFLDNLKKGRPWELFVFWHWKNIGDRIFNSMADRLRVSWVVNQVVHCCLYKLFHFMQLNLSQMKFLVCYGMIDICGLSLLFFLSCGIRHSNA